MSEFKLVSCILVAIQKRHSGPQPAFHRRESPNTTGHSHPYCHIIPRAFRTVFRASGRVARACARACAARGPQAALSLLFLIIEASGGAGGTRSCSHCKASPLQSARHLLAVWPKARTRRTCRPRRHDRGPAVTRPRLPALGRLSRRTRVLDAGRA